jgi:hypothetical protein
MPPGRRGSPVGSNNRSTGPARPGSPAVRPNKPPGDPGLLGSRIGPKAVPVARRRRLPVGPKLGSLRLGRPADIGGRPEIGGRPACGETGCRTNPALGRFPVRGDGPGAMRATPGRTPAPGGRPGAPIPPGPRSPGGLPCLPIGPIAGPRGRGPPGRIGGPAIRGGPGGRGGPGCADAFSLFPPNKAKLTAKTANGLLILIITPLKSPASG